MLNTCWGREAGDPALWNFRKMKPAEEQGIPNVSQPDKRNHRKCLARAWFVVNIQVQDEPVKKAYTKDWGLEGTSGESY